MTFSLHIPIREQREQAQTERRMAEATMSGFWRGLTIGFICAFPIFDGALTGGATLRALARLLHAVFGH